MTRILSTDTYTMTPFEMVIIPVYCALVLSIGFLFLVKWVTLRNYFPLKESSPKLILLTGIAIVAHMIFNPLAYLLLDGSDETHKALNIAISALRIVEYIPYFLRILRVWLVFKSTTRNGFIIALFKREKNLIIIFLLISAIVVSVLTFTSWGDCIPGFFHNFYSQLCPDNTTNLVWYLMEYSIFPVLMIFAFSFKDLDPIYPFTSELTYVGFVLYSSSIAEDLIFNNDIELTSFPLMLIILVIRDLLQFYFMIIRQIRNAQAFHLVMPTTIKLNDEVDRFIEDELCYKLFYAYVEHKSTEVDNLKHGSGQTLELLNFLSKIIIIERIETSEQSERAKQLINEYIANADLFPSTIKESIIEKMNSPFDLGNNKYIHLLSDAITFTYTTLNKAHQDYKKTKSWSQLKKILEKNEFYYERLGLFGMF